MDDRCPICGEARLLRPRPDPEPPYRDLYGRGNYTPRLLNGIAVRAADAATWGPLEAARLGAIARP